MAFCRFGDDSDVYVFDDSETLTCCWCQLLQDRDFNGTYLEMKEHLLAHRAAGHKVPDYAISRLEVEANVKQTIFGADIETRRLAPPERN